MVAPHIRWPKVGRLGVEQQCTDVGAFASVFIGGVCPRVFIGTLGRCIAAAGVAAAAPARLDVAGIGWFVCLVSGLAASA